MSKIIKIVVWFVTFFFKIHLHLADHEVRKNTRLAIVMSKISIRQNPSSTLFKCSLYKIRVFRVVFGYSEVTPKTAERITVAYQDILFINYPYLRLQTD